MKTNKKKEQFELANALFEMGMDYEIIKKISGISSSELLMHKIKRVQFEKEKNK